MVAEEVLENFIILILLGNWSTKVIFKVPVSYPENQTDADPGGSGSWSNFAVTKKLNFYMKNMLYVGTIQ